MATWYHFCREERLRRYQDDQAIVPISWFIRPQDWPSSIASPLKDSAIFGLHNPIPDICTPHIHEHYCISDALLKDIARGQKLYLLEIQSTQEDRLFVTDTSVFQEQRNLTIPNHIPRGSEQEQKLRETFKQQISEPAYSAYYQNLVPFSEYKLGQYKEPEIVCFNKIPLERARVIKQIDRFVYTPPPTPPDLLDELLNGLG